MQTPRLDNYCTVTRYVKSIITLNIHKCVITSMLNLTIKKKKRLVKTVGFKQFILFNTLHRLLKNTGGYYQVLPFTARFGK